MQIKYENSSTSITTDGKRLRIALAFVASALLLLCSNCQSCDSSKRQDELLCGKGEIRQGGVCVSVVGIDCETPADCETGICYAGICTIECVNNNDCPVGFDCISIKESDAKYCLLNSLDGSTGCVNDGDCPENYYCSDGRCIYNGDNSLYECLVNEDCEENERCFERKCLADSEGVWGEPCDPYWREECVSENTECVMLSYTNGLCLTSCDSEHPCATNQMCRLLPGGRSYCMPGEWQCFSDTMCEEGNTCQFIMGGSSQRAVGVCQKAIEGAIKAGDECEPGDVSCEGGLCPEGGFCSQPCASDGDCPPGMLCEEVYFTTPGGNESKSAGCVDMMAAKSRFGELCSADDECRRGICYNEGEGGSTPFCSITCDPELYDCPYSYECKQEEGEYICLPEYYTGECINDSDCGVGQVCGVVVDSMAKTVEIYCVAGAEGGVPSGSSCDYLSGDPYCLNGYCEYPGICGGLCGGTQDCPQGLVCGYSEVNRGDGVVIRIRRCQPDTGSRQLCNSNADCPEKETCVLYLTNRSVSPQQRCITASDIGREIGEECMVSYECNSLLCTQSGRCTSLCESNKDCPDNHFCGLAVIPISESLESVHRACVFNEGNTGELGAPCPNGPIDCGDDLTCFDDGQGVTFCTKQCITNEDCDSEDAGECGNLGPAGDFCKPQGYEPP